ncbi:MAG: peptide chain release factor N(5)-glutamine methyltransferase [Rhodocyclaceae bacterium]|nr:peptide chain release factor N(5)-glutamine methyltransferase [Rhodocyclaceae bacterium]
MNSIAAALAAARQRIPAAEARLLLCHLLGRNTAWLEAHRDEALDEPVSSRFSAWVQRRQEGEPVAYLLGRREFYGRDFAVSPAVLIPRPETELLVELALQKMAECSQPRILDLGTGSGCLAITLALECPTAQVTAVDASAAALAVATENARQLGAVVRFVESDWYAALAARDSERFDLIVSNPPYIAPGDPHLSQGDLRFEPASALAAPDNGLADLRHIVTGASDCLLPGAWLLCEHGYDQAEAMVNLLTVAGFSVIEQHRDLAGIIRVSGGCLTSVGPGFNIAE